MLLGWKSDTLFKKRTGSYYNNVYPVERWIKTVNTNLCKLLFIRCFSENVNIFTGNYVML